ncbi:MAG: hypothetical protein U0X91_04805 [Spirosomataceae bacterium]
MRARVRGGVWTRPQAGTGGTFNAAAGTLPLTRWLHHFDLYLYDYGRLLVPMTRPSLQSISRPTKRRARQRASVCDNSTTAINLFSLITGEARVAYGRVLQVQAGAFNAAASTLPGRWSLRPLLIPLRARLLVPAVVGSCHHRLYLNPMRVKTSLVCANDGTAPSSTTLVLSPPN